MAPPPKVTATDAELKSFDWLPLEKWSVETIFNYFKVEEGHLCKICDKYERVSRLSLHVKKHKAARLELKEKEKKEALEKAKETRRLKKLEKDRERNL